MKMPRQSVTRPWEAIRQRDRAALELLADRGDNFTVPAFCAEWILMGHQSGAGPKPGKNAEGEKSQSEKSQ